MITVPRGFAVVSKSDAILILSYHQRGASGYCSDCYFGWPCEAAEMAVTIEKLWEEVERGEAREEAQAQAGRSTRVHDDVPTGGA